MSKHIHAELMMQYAQDAMETDKPWERWESKESAFNSFPWAGFVESPTWNPGWQYRRKPKPYEPTLLDQALELEIEAAAKRMDHYVRYGNNGCGDRLVLVWIDLKEQRSPEMIEHLKSQGKL